MDHQTLDRITTQISGHHISKETARRWAEELMKYDPQVKDVLDVNIGRKPMYWTITYFDEQKNILTYIIRLT